jgi:hypothetical protein
MALVVEDGTGLADAESYASVAAADAYATARGLTWTGTETEKEQALRRATSWLDARYRGKWPGDKRRQRFQALEWPRTGAHDMADDPIDYQSVPVEVVNATIEAAAREAATPGGLSPDVTGEKVLTRLGELGWTLTGTGPEAKRPVLTVIDDILSRLIYTGRGVTRVLRA